MVYKEITHLGQEGLKVLVGEVIQLVTDEVEDSATVAVSVEITDSHPGVEKLGAKEAQEPAHRERWTGRVGR